MTQEALITAVQEQRTKLINVIGAVQCMRIAVRHKPPMELEGAVELLEDELQRILNALDPVELERSLRALSDRQDAAGPSEEARL
jgi:hypothetical protein